MIPNYLSDHRNLCKAILGGCKLTSPKRSLLATINFLKSIQFSVVALLLVFILAFTKVTVASATKENTPQDNSLALSHESELKPIVDCVIEVNLGLVAYFGYKNGHDRKLDFEIGTNNSFSPEPINRGQPTEFNVGHHHYMFMVYFNKNSSVTWNLNRRTVTASFDSPRCPFPTSTLSPEPTETVIPSATATQPPEPTETVVPPSATATQPPEPTETVVPPSATATQPPEPTETVVPPSATATQSPEPTETVIPSATATEPPEPTETVFPPSATATQSPEPTDTVVPPSATATQTPEPTDTVVPPSATATQPPEPTDTVVPPSAIATQTPEPTETVVLPSATPTRFGPIWIIRPTSPDYPTGSSTPTPPIIQMGTNIDFVDSPPTDTQDDFGRKVSVTLIDLFLAISTFLTLSYSLSNSRAPKE